MNTLECIWRVKTLIFLWCKSVWTLLLLLNEGIKKQTSSWNQVSPLSHHLCCWIFFVPCLYVCAHVCVCVWMWVDTLHVQQRTLRGTWGPGRSSPSTLEARMRLTSVTMATACLAGGCCGNGSIPGQRKWRYRTGWQHNVLVTPDSAAWSRSNGF